jgi:GNAT superfamily N-acetyltransferase
MSGSAPAATCRPGPSPSARALRLETLRAPDSGALRRLLESLPAPPWDLELADDDPALPLVRAEGFEPYSRVALMSRPIAGLPRAPHVGGTEVGDYRNADAEAFTALEAAAMEGLPQFTEMGQPTGYAEAEGFDIFLAARDAEGALHGFAQTMSPEGWINWLGVDPGMRRIGIGHLLIAETASRLAAVRGTHLAAAVEVDTGGQAFLAALGFRERGARRTRLIRRAG